MAVDKLVWKMILDFVVLVLVASPLLVIILWIEPYHRGYHPNDPSLGLPYKAQTISEWMLAVIGFAVNIVAIIIIEVVLDKRGKGPGEKFICGSIIPGWVWESYKSIGIFTFGAACQQTTVNMAKVVIGRLRPHFFAVCQPIPTAGSTLNTAWYIEEYQCAGPDASLFDEMRVSFPSAHSSFSIYSALFFIFHLQTKAKWRGSKLLRHAFQFAALLGAWYVGLTRVVENMHHWSDVAAGFLVGSIYAVLVFKYVLKPKTYREPARWQEPNQENILPRPVLAR